MSQWMVRQLCYFRSWRGSSVLGALLVWAGGACEAGELLDGPALLVRRALISNPGVGAASLRAEAAREAVDRARGAWYPKVYTAAGVVGTDNPPQAFMMSLNQRSLDMSDPGFDPNNPDDTSNIRVSVGLEYRLWDGGARGSQVGAAQASALGAEARWASVRNGLAFEVVRGYYQVMRTRAHQSVQASTMVSIESSLSAAQSRLTAGSAVRSDVLNLEVSMAEAREGLIRASNGVALALAALNTAIGSQDEVVLGDFPTQLVPEHYPKPIDPVVGSCGLRPEAAGAAARLGAAEKRLVGAHAVGLPYVDLMASVDWDGEDGGSMEQSYLAGVVARWDIFAGGGVRAGVRQATAARDAAELAQQSLLNRLALELREAVIRQAEAHERLGVTRQSVVHSEEALRMGQSQYMQGTMGLAELLVSQAGLTASKNRHVGAYYDYLVARANVQRAGGCLVGAMGGDDKGDAGDA